ncbi:MAG: putative toxin-antitoxin system toxin component, PIN family [Reyranella sp.]|jgi:putative PIN family toxin of toxin-antitoxin system|nr:putative toxin-antitoxin system toxin component, PIN family [Reyranella sp.]
MRLVFDTDVMVAAIRSDAGASRRVLQAFLERQRGLTLLASVPLLFEYEAVMTRPEHLRAARLSLADVSALLDAVAATAEPVRLAYLWRPALRDVDDDMVLETAVNGAADGIVTFNRRDFAPAAGQFGVRVLLPGEAVRHWEQGS